MPRACRVCIHPERAKIDEALIKQVSLRQLEAKYGISKSSIQRHKVQNHIARKIANAVELEVRQEGLDLHNTVLEIRDYLKDIIKKTYESQSFTVSVSALRELRGLLDTCARVLGVTQENLVDREWLDTFKNIRTATTGTEGTEDIKLAFRPTEDRLTDLKLKAWNLGISPDVVEARLSESLDSWGNVDEKAGIDALEQYLNTVELHKDDTQGYNGEKAQKGVHMPCDAMDTSQVVDGGEMDTISTSNNTDEKVQPDRPKSVLERFIEQDKKIMLEEEEYDI